MAAVPFPQLRRARRTQLLSSGAGLQPKHLYPASHVPQASLNSAQGPHPRKRCLEAVVFVHINPQPGNPNRIPPSRYLGFKFIIPPRGKLPMEFIGTQFSAALGSPRTTLKFKDISSSDGNASPGQHPRKPTGTDVLPHVSGAHVCHGALL